MNTPTTWALLNLQNMFGADPFYLDEDGSCAWLDQSFQHPGIIFPMETEQRDILMKGTLTISANYNYLPIPINEHSTSTCQLSTFQNESHPKYAKKEEKKSKNFDYVCNLCQRNGWSFRLFQINLLRTACVCAGIHQHVPYMMLRPTRSPEFQPSPMIMGFG